jgi:molybdopterin/thiamine biosynthesis adenylyltransferase
VSLDGSSFANRRVLLVGVGGLGSPAAIALAASGVGTIGIADDDEVEVSNLHRQILYREADVGRSKPLAASRAIPAWAPGIRVVVHGTRLLPDNAVEIVSRYDVVLEGSDNFATKFLTADACALAGVAVVHGAAVRWHGTALAVGPRGRPCYRCLFEDLPNEYSPNCAEAGVMGPVVGVIGAIQADLALGLLGDSTVASPCGTLVTFDGKTDVLRRRRVVPRQGCDLCGPGARIRRLDAARYTTVSELEGDGPSPRSPETCTVKPRAAKSHAGAS